MTYKLAKAMLPYGIGISILFFAMIFGAIIWIHGMTAFSYAVESGLAFALFGPVILVVLCFDEWLPKGENENDKI